MADLDAATTADVQEFFRTYYAPGNARLVVAGDFKPVEARKLIADYFSDIQGASAPPPVECKTTFGGGPVRRTATDKLANLPASVHFYRIPAHDHADTPALELLGIILGQGESSRLKLTLVREARAAVASQAGIFGNRRGPGAFGALAIANQGVTADSIDALLTTQIGYLGDSLSEADVTKAKNIYRASVISSRQSAFDIAEALQHAALFLGSPEAANTDFRRYMAVTVDDVRRVARTYLRPENSLTLIVNVEAQR
jgi:predicted Zn-dependent peptidase